jgi:hypothetical protein
MNTDRQHSPPSEDDTQPELSEDEGEALMQLLEELDNIDEDAEEAPLNRCSISDNNGGRIELIKRPRQKPSAFLFLRRLLYIPRKIVKPEQEDST